MSRQAGVDFYKLQIVCSLFSKTVCDDLYFAQQIKESIEASLPQNEADTTHRFVNRAKELVAKLEGDPTHTGIELIEATPNSAPFSMLDLRVNLLIALKRICPFDSGLVILTGLKKAIRPNGKRWSKSRKQDYEEAISFAREFCLKRSRPSSQVSLVIV